MIKVLLCTNSFEQVTNGPAKFANLLLQVNDAGYPLEVRVLTEDVAREHQYVYKLNMHSGLKRSFISQFVRMFKYHRVAMEIRKNYSFDVIIYNNAIISLWSSFRFKPVVGMINDYSNATASLSELSFSFNVIKRLLFKQLEKLAVVLCDRTIVNSNYLLNHLIDEYPLMKSKGVILYKAIDLSRAQKKSTPERKLKNIIRVLFVKNDFLTGGLDILIDAIRKLKEYKFEITVIGPPLDREQEIRTIIAFDAKLNFLGRQSQEFVFKQMIDHDIFCVPSKKEALGVSNIEAMASGISVVSSSAGGVPEVLDGGNAGWMSNPGDADSLAKCLQECIENPQMRQAKIEFGFKQAQKFSKEFMYNDLFKILRNVNDN